MDTSNFKEVFESPKVKTLTAQVAALEAEVMRLREALEHLSKAAGQTIDVRTPKDWVNLNIGLSLSIQALSTPFTPTTLTKLIEKVEKIWREKCAEYCAKTGWKMDYDEIPEGIRALPTGQIDLMELI